MKQVSFVIGLVLASVASAGAVVACQIKNGDGGDGGVDSTDASTDSDTSDASDEDVVDASTDGDADAAHEFACDPPTRIDTRNISDKGISAVAFGDEWLVDWYETPLLSTDGKPHLKARAFDGTAMLEEQDLDTIEALSTSTASIERTPIVVDGTGHAFLQWWSKSPANVPTGTRNAYDFASNAFGTGTSFTVEPFGTQLINAAYAIAALPAGGALSVYRGPTSPKADRFQANAWAALSLSGGEIPTQFRVATNAAGKGAALWNDLVATKMAISTFDGTNFATPVLTPMPGVNHNIAVMANGDVLVVWASALDLSLQRFRAATQAFDPAEKVQSGGGNVTLAAPQIVVDADDNITIAWREGTLTRGRRKIGGTWSAVAEFGGGASVALALDSKSNVVAVPADSALGIRIFRAGPTDTTWADAVPTGLHGLDLGSFIYETGAITFDKNRNIQLFVTEQQTSGKLELAYTKCH